MTPVEEQERQSLRQLRLRLLGFALLTLATLSAVSLVLPDGSRGRFFAGALVASIGIFAYVFNHLGQNRLSLSSTDPNVRAMAANRLLPIFGWGTSLTLVRATALGVLAGFLLVPRPAEVAGWWPAFLYLVVALGDGLDGYLARRHNQSTVLGPPSTSSSTRSAP